jgi:hypothetical protein
MRRLLTVPLLCLGGIATAADNVASDYWVRVMPAAWFVAFDGDAKYTENGVPGDNLSLDDLDLANSEAGFGLEVSAKLPILFSFHAGGYVVGTDGSFNTGGVDFGGQNFTGNVNSSLDVSDLYIEADLQLLDLDLVGCAIGVGYHLPMLTSLGAEAKIHWIELSYDDTGVSYIDATIQITWRPWEMIGFIGGYRHVAADLSFDSPAGVNADADLDLTLSGPFLGLTAQF